MLFGRSCSWLGLRVKSLPYFIFGADRQFGPMRIPECSRRHEAVDVCEAEIGIKAED